MALFILIREIMIQSMTRRDQDIVGHQTDEGRVDTVQMSRTYNLLSCSQNRCSTCYILVQHRKITIQAAIL